MKFDTSIPGIKKYYIGFAVLGAVVLGFTIFTLSLASAAKQDKVTVEKAREVADQLNDYIRTNRKIPDDLSVLSVKDIPNTISYEKKSDIEYEFCVTYKTASSYSTPDITGAVAGPLLGGYSGGVDYYADEEVSTYKPSSLYISSYSHKKGEDCQTIEPYLYSSLNSSLFGSSGSSVTTSAARDNERKLDINSLHAQAEAYYNQNGRYPTLENFNSATWRSTNMRGLSSGTLRDPQGSSSQLAETSTSIYTYTYKVYGKGGISETCDNVNTDCAQYTLSATLSDGSVYTKSSLN